MQNTRILSRYFLNETRVQVFGLAAIIAGMAGCKSTGSSGVKIVGGKEVTDSDDQRVMNATVAIYTETPEGKFAGCTGTLIGPRHVVTAAHCAGSRSSKYYVGWGPRTDPNGPMVEASAVSQHPLWSGQQKDISRNDIAVISLTKPLPAPMTPVALAGSDDVKSGTELILAGYGLTSYSDASSAGILRQVKVKAKYVENYKRIVQIEPYTKRGGCRGDSGGPAFIDQAGTLKLVGATHGPNRGMEQVDCKEGHGTWNMVNLYQGWLKCAFAAHKNPLDGLIEDASSIACEAKSPVAQSPSTPTKGSKGDGTGAPVMWCDPYKQDHCFPYCTNGSNTGNGFGWQDELGGSCKIATDKSA